MVEGLGIRGVNEPDLLVPLSRRGEGVMNEFDGAFMIVPVLEQGKGEAYNSVIKGRGRAVTGVGEA